MKLVFDIASSAVFWRRRYPADRSPQTPQPVLLDDCASRKRDIAALLPDWVDSDYLASTGGVFHALAFDRSQSHQLRSTVVHSWGGSIPEGSFYELNDHVLVESPAFMFLQAATVLDYASLIAFGDELCGLYSFDEREKRGFTKRKKPLVRKVVLENYLAQALGCRGRELALQALPHVIELSASPMETYDEMTMCLPIMRGGYHFMQPYMNYPVTLTSKASRIARRKTCYLDMGYPDACLDVEHHGKLDHSSDEDKASDFARVNGLKEMGYEVVELTWEQVGDLFAYEYIIERIARIMGKRLPKQVLGATEERVHLRKTIAMWNAAYGRIRCIR